jgi:hypothetical protein
MWESCKIFTELCSIPRQVFPELCGVAVNYL